MHDRLVIIVFLGKVYMQNYEKNISNNSSISMIVILLILYEKRTFLGFGVFIYLKYF